MIRQQKAAMAWAEAAPQESTGSKANHHRRDRGHVHGGIPLSDAIARLVRKNAKSRSYALAATSRLRHGQDK